MTRHPPGPLPEGQSRDDLVAEVSRALAPVPEGASVLVAVSGGPDSGALAHLTVEARPDLDLTLGHVRHGLRDDAEDVAAVEALAAALGVALLVADVSVQPDGEGLEAAARAARYAALRRLCRQAGGGWLLVGHTADDQAETLLLRLARGTGVGGLGGMAPVRGDLVRPLLRVRRSDVRNFVALEGVAAVDDPMNVDRAFRRVRARHEVLPVLEGLAADPVAALARLADLARVDAGYLDARAAELAAGLVRRYGPTRALPADALRALDTALARRIVRHLVGTVRGHHHPVSAAHVNDVLTLEPGSAVDLPGVSVTCGGGWLAVAPHELDVPQPVVLALPGRVAWRAADVTISATLRALGPVSPSSSDSDTDPVCRSSSDSDSGPDGQLRLPLEVPWRAPTVTVEAAALPPGADPSLGQVVLGGPRIAPGGTLTVRSRAPGDRVRTPAGTRKVQDLLVDAGVPRAARDLVPIVTAGDRIVWIPGVAADRELLAAGKEQPLLHLAVAPLRGSVHG